jgi:transcriptional regulator with XRE-family HTH domain
VVDIDAIRTEARVGALLRKWRRARKLTQLELALEAEVSTRHLSFIETGRSQPSASMILVLGSVLELPLRERNALLIAAGYPPAYTDTDLDAPELAPVRRVIDHVLENAEPYGAVVVDGRWNLLRANQAATRFTARFARNRAAVLAAGAPNLIRLLMHPDGVRPFCVNWDAVAREMVLRLHRELALSQDADLARLLNEVLSYEDVPADWRRFEVGSDASLLVPLHMRRDDLDLRLLSTITTLGTTYDVTLRDLRIETFFPMDDATARQLRSLAESEPT